MNLEILGENMFAELGILCSSSLTKVYEIVKHKTMF